MPEPTRPTFEDFDLGGAYTDAVNTITNPALRNQLFGATQEDLGRYVGLYNDAATQQAFGQGSVFDANAAMRGVTPEVASQLQTEWNRLREQGDTRDFNTWLGAWAQAGAEQGDPNAMRMLEENQTYDPNSDVGRALDSATAFSQAEREAQSAGRRSTMEDVISLGPQLNDIFRASNPELQGALSRAGALSESGNFFGGLESAINNTPQFGGVGFNAAQAAPNVQAERVQAGQVGRGELGQSLLNQAMGATGLGETGQALSDRARTMASSTGELSADELRQLQQGIREGYADRGTLDSSGAVTAEALGRLTNTRERMLQDLGMSADLNQGALAEQAQNRGFRQDVQGQDVARQQSNLGLALTGNMANQSTALDAGKANQGVQQETNIFNTALKSDLGLANRDFAFNQAQQGIDNQALLGELFAGQYQNDRDYALGMVDAQRASSIDPWMALTGVSSMAPQAGAGMGQTSYNNISGITGSNMFDPSGGVNASLVNSSNRANFDANMYSSDMALEAARRQASATKSAGLFAGLGSLFGGIFG